MALFLVQHGKSLSRETDPDAGLSPEGISETERIAGVAGGYGVRVSVIRHSTKARARETAEIFAAALRPEGGLEETTGLKPMDDVSVFAGNITADDNAMLVGHLPFMGRMASHLVTGSADMPIFSFQNSGILCLDRDPGSISWVIKWTLMPNIG